MGAIERGGLRDSKQREYFVDVIKGICALFVIVTHFNLSWEERTQYLFPFWIDMAVPIFMIISGYVNTKSYQNNQIDTFNKAYAMNGIIKKLVRVMVPFVIVFIIEEAICIWQGASINFWQFGFDFLNGGKGPGSYYFPIMLQFIFVFPAIFFIVKSHAKKGVVICFVINFIFELLQRAYGMTDGLYRLLVFRYIFVIACGCYLASEQFEMKKWMSALSIGIGAGFIVLCCYLEYTPKIIVYWTRTSFVACLYIIPIIAVLIRRFGRIRFKPLEVCGKASFNVFLFQMLYYSFIEYKIDILTGGILHLFINLAICTIGGVLFYYIEKPITNKISCLVDKIER